MGLQLWIEEKMANNTPFSFRCSHYYQSYVSLLSCPIIPPISLQACVFVLSFKNTDPLICWRPHHRIHSAPLFAPSPSRHRHNQLFPVLQLALYLTALCPLPSFFITTFFRIQTDNPLIHQLLLLSPETGRAPFYAVISHPGVFTENSPHLTRTHTWGSISLSWQTPGRCLWSHVPPIASSLWSELSQEADAGLQGTAASRLSLNSVLLLHTSKWLFKTPGPNNLTCKLWAFTTLVELVSMSLPFFTVKPEQQENHASYISTSYEAIKTPVMKPLKWKIVQSAPQNMNTGCEGIFWFTAVTPSLILC